MKHDHIDDFCRQLASVWKRVPNWRFGQLMSNMLGEYQAETKRDIFHPSDDELMAFFKEYVSMNSHYKER